MRAPQRIPILMEKINFEQFIADLKVFENPKEVSDQIDLFDVLEFWNENPDYRLTQVLIQLGYLPNSPGGWFYIEEDNWAIEKGLVKFEEIHFWGVNYDKDGNRLPKTIFKPLHELTTEHIENIIKWIKDNHQDLSPEYLNYFRSRIISTAVDKEGKGWVDDLLNNL